jgi:hypothetical protein
VTLLPLWATKDVIVSGVKLRIRLIVPSGKEWYMLRKGVLVLLAAAAAACSGGAPSDAEVKQALYDRYATVQGGADLQRALDKEVVVSDCRQSGAEYRCLIENKALGSTIPMFFAHDKAQNKWKFTKEETN